MAYFYKSCESTHSALFAPHVHTNRLLRLAVRTGCPMEIPSSGAGERSPSGRVRPSHRSRSQGVDGDLWRTPTRRNVAVLDLIQCLGADRARGRACAREAVFLTWLAFGHFSRISRLYLSRYTHRSCPMLDVRVLLVHPMLIGACNSMIYLIHVFRHGQGAVEDPASDGFYIFGGCGNFDIIFGPFSRFPPLHTTPRHPRRVAYSTWFSCLWDDDCNLML